MENERVANEKVEALQHMIVQMHKQSEFERQTQEMVKSVQVECDRKRAEEADQKWEVEESFRELMSTLKRNQ